MKNVNGDNSDAAVELTEGVKDVAKVGALGGTAPVLVSSTMNNVTTIPSSVLSPPSHVFSPPSVYPSPSPASLHPSLQSASLSPATPQTLQVPVSGQGPSSGGPGGQARPSVPAAARRGTNVAVSKRTRFALQVQKPTGENSDTDSVINIQDDNGINLTPTSLPSVSAAGGQTRKPVSPGSRGGHQPQPRGRGRGSETRPGSSEPSRGRGRGDARGDVNRLSGAQMRQRFVKNNNGCVPASGPLGPDQSQSTDTESLVQQPEYNKLKMRSVPERADPSQSCSPITLEYAEELLLMAYDGRCSVMDVSQVPKENPSGGYVYIYHSPEMPYAWKNDDGYRWSEILHQMDMVTAKGNKIDYYHFYIELPGKKAGEKKRSSPNFRKEAYKMNDYTLVAYIGDHNIVDKREETLKQKRDKILGSMSMHANLQQLAKERPYLTNLSSVAGVKTIPGRGYNTISGVSSVKQVNSLPRRQRSQSLERAKSPSHKPGDVRAGAGELKQFPFPVVRQQSSPTNVYISDPDMMASKLVEQEYLQSLDQARSAKKQNVFDQLWELSNDLSNGKFVKNISIYPALQLTLVHPDMTREFENICKILYSERCPGDLEDETMKLFYDMTFEIGDMFVTILTFTNYFYVGCPVMPLAVNIHERKFKSSHSLFWARVLCDIPALAKYRFPIVINEAEPAVHLAVKAHAPNLIQFEGWVHRFKDMDKYMRQKGYGAHAVGYFKACIKYLLMSESRGDMIDKFQKEFEGIWPRDFVNYFKERVLPKANRLGKWALGEVNIYDESFFNHAGSPQERFHLRCNQFHDWDTLGIGRLVEAFYLLMTYYVNECSSAKAGQGAFAIHPDLKSLFCEMLPENLPYNCCPPPAEIVQYLKMTEPEEKSVNLLAVHEKSEMYSPSSYNYRSSMMTDIPLNYQSSAFSFTSGVNTSSINSFLPDSKFSFNHSLDEFGLSSLQPSWLSNGDILTLTEDDRSGHVPSPAPGDNSNNLHSPQRKLSVIPEVPGFSRPPSLAELAVAKQKSGSNGDQSFEIIVSGAKETSATIIRQGNGYFNPSALPRGLATYDKLQQHSIESSVVTEGHYDASFETEDQPASFDVDPGNYIYLDEQPPTLLSNGHFKMCPQEMKMLGMNHGGAKSTPVSGESKSTNKRNMVNCTTAAQKAAAASTIATINSSEVNGSSTVTTTATTLGHQPQEGRKGELNIQSIPSEVEIVKEKNGTRDQQYQGDGGNGDTSLIVQPDQGGTMLWKRVRHCVVFGGKIVKPKKEKDSK